MRVVCLLYSSVINRTHHKVGQHKSVETGMQPALVHSSAREGQQRLNLGYIHDMYLLGGWIDTTSDTLVYE